MKKKVRTKEKMTEPPAWTHLQHIKFKEAVEEWRKMGGKDKKGIKIIRADSTKTSTEKTKEETFSSSTSTWKRLYDSHYDAYYYYNEETREAQWENPS